MQHYHRSCTLMGYHPSPHYISCNVVAYYLCMHGHTFLYFCKRKERLSDRRCKRKRVSLPCQFFVQSVTVSPFSCHVLIPVSPFSILSHGAFSHTQSVFEFLNATVVSDEIFRWSARVTDFLAAANPPSTYSFVNTSLPPFSSPPSVECRWNIKRARRLQAYTTSRSYVWGGRIPTFSIVFAVFSCSSRVHVSSLLEY